MSKYLGPKKKLYKNIDQNLLFILNKRKLNLLEQENINNNFSLSNNTNDDIKKDIKEKKSIKDIKEKKSIKDIKEKKSIKDIKEKKSIIVTKKHKLTDFKLRLLEKQKVRRIYGIFEKQFFNYYKKALKSKLNTGEKLIQLLESRLDNTVYRMGLALTRNQARQLIVHKHILVNNNIINIPSYQILKYDKICLIIKNKKLIDQAKIIMNSIEIVKWLSVEVKNLSGQVKYLPNKKDLPTDIEIKEQLIIEFYAK